MHLIFTKLALLWCHLILQNHFHSYNKYFLFLLVVIKNPMCTSSITSITIKLLFTCNSQDIPTHLRWQSLCCMVVQKVMYGMAEFDFCNGYCLEDWPYQPDWLYQPDWPDSLVNSKITPQLTLHENSYWVGTGDGGVKPLTVRTVGAPPPLGL